MILNEVPNILYNGEPVSVWCNGLKIWPKPTVYFTVTSNDYQGVQVGLSAYDRGSLSGYATAYITATAVVTGYAQ